MASLHEPILPPPGEETITTRAARATVGVALVLLAFSSAFLARQVLLLVLIALILAVGLDPAVRFLQRHLKLARGWAVFVIVILTTLLVSLFFALVIPPMVREIRNFAQDIPGYIERLKSSSGFIGELEQKYHLSERLKKITEDLPNALSGSFSSIFGVTKSLAATVFNLLTIAVLTLYIMANLPRLRDGIVALFPQEKRSRYAEVVDESTERIGGYVSGNITVSIIAGVFSFIFFLVLGIPFGAALAMWVAFTDLVPSIGALLGAVLCVLVAFFSGVGVGIATIVYFVVYQQVENYLISPRVMKKAVDLSPAIVIIAVLIGSALLGFVGALIALPVAAAAKVMIRELWLEDRLAHVREVRSR